MLPVVVAAVAVAAAAAAEATAAEATTVEVTWWVVRVVGLGDGYKNSTDLNSH